MSVFNCEKNVTNDSEDYTERFSSKYGSLIKRDITR